MTKQTDMDLDLAFLPDEPEPEPAFVFPARAYDAWKTADPLEDEGRGRTYAEQMVAIGRGLDAATVVDLDACPWRENDE